LSRLKFELVEPEHLELHVMVFHIQMNSGSAS